MAARGILSTMLAACAVLITPACAQPECANPDYTRAECRVQIEHELARGRTADGVEVRFQHPEVSDDTTWSALGLVQVRGEDVTARIATLGGFALSLSNPTSAEAVVRLSLGNVHDRAELTAGPVGHEEVVSPPGAGTERHLSMTLAAGERRWVHGRLDCPPVARVLALADVQTNPTQLSRIVERIHQEDLDASAAGELVAGVVIAGDLSEDATSEELAAFAERLLPAAVPFAVVPGNHDVFSGAHPSYNEEFGPGNYAFDVCGAHFAMFDSGSGTLASSILGRLPELLARGDAQSSVAVVHHPAYARLSGAGWSSEADAALFLGEVAFQRGDLVLSGHAHRLARFVDVAPGSHRVDQLIVGTGGAVQNAKSPLFGYLRLTLGAEGIRTCFVEVPPPGAEPTAADELAIPPCVTP